MNISSDHILKSAIRELLSDALEDLQSYTNLQPYQTSLEKYISVLDMLLKPYKHHLGHSFDSQNAAFRFQVETALLRLLSEIIKIHLYSEETDNIFIWPIDDVNNLFTWYKLPDRFSNSLTEIAKHLSTIHYPELLLSEICGDVLSDLGDTVIGEFYTPLKVADHLIESSGITPQDILAGKRAIDPACVGGIVLLMLFIQVGEFGKKANIPSSELLEILSDNILGFDIQPFAVEVTKTLLFYSRFLLFGTKANITNETLPKIDLKDTLSTDKIYWPEAPSQENLNGFDFIIGNPPYMSVKGADIPNIKEYNEVTYGHPNLYQLFIWWAIRAAKPNSVVCFLIPQSIISERV